MSPIYLSLLAFFAKETSGHKHRSHEYLVDNSHVAESSPFIHHLQNYLFPFNARYNSMLATLIIQLMPCVVVQLIPGLKNGGDSPLLSILVAFALGTLLGDVLLHLIPEIFDSIVDSANPHADGLVLSSAIFVGFFLFLFLDKSIRILSQGDGIHSHSHGHSHSHTEAPGKEKKEHQESTSPLLNVATGFIHNVTDGIALASSFYTSKHVGVTTSVAVIFHEIPHELGDFAILLSSGFTFPQALKSQFVTSLGALMGTAIGCALNEMPTTQAQTQEKPLGFDVSQLLLPITAGGFLYLSTVGVVPQLLQPSSSPNDSNRNKAQEFKKWLAQLASILTGFSLMLYIALQE
ncbi:hypothetical protein ZYGR_0AK06900 [Zygosaccharomyces rouxii]|uniref:Zinc transporter YKE4 n=1 Tax=Zygosaccharomyces rouxii TaxID=4956 RepID=A0A1Q3AER3_ZYGRO|nr:hypothetical protein ZYGR_0AK06900 [Zygosaccharomyces rouxii]